MRLFKTVDEKFAEIGFIKRAESECGIIYERENRQHKFIHELALIHKKNGKHIIQSYDRELMDEKKIGNTCVGLTMYEITLCLKKMKQMGWKMVK